MREYVLVLRVDRTEIALRRDVQANRIHDRAREVRLEEAIADLLVLEIDADPRRVVALAVDQVPDVVEERGGDELDRRAVELRVARGLEHVLAQRHRLAEIRVRSMRVEVLEDDVNRTSQRRSRVLLHAEVSRAL